MSRENRTCLMLTDEELKAIDDWRFANRVMTRAEAIRRLIEMALTQPAKDSEPAT